MTLEKYIETKIKLRHLKNDIRNLEIGSPKYNAMLFDIKILSNAIELHNLSKQDCNNYNKLD